ncbi:MAG: hypothetical protein EA422_07650 [Gemmatimonadales bacterium]|nr:MAG: hypothetical protein EA422_07650 [Gemmatimonadales bacterium]
MAAGSIHGSRAPSREAPVPGGGEMSDEIQHETGEPMRRLPLFPLPVVLFPGAAMPLHIFEPRYRQMVARCIEYDRKFGLVYHDPDRMGPFGMEPDRVGTIAEIGEFQILPDGRSLLVATGGPRFRIVDGIESDTLYYEALVEPFHDDTEEEEELMPRRQRSLTLFEALVERIHDDEDAGEATSGADADPREGSEAEGGDETPGDAGPEAAPPGVAPTEAEEGFAGERRNGTADSVPRPESGLDPAEEISFQLAARIRIDPLWQQSLLEIRHESERLSRLDALLSRVLDASSGGENGW